MRFHVREGTALVGLTAAANILKGENMTIKVETSVYVIGTLLGLIMCMLSFGNLLPVFIAGSIIFGGGVLGLFVKLWSRQEKKKDD